MQGWWYTTWPTGHRPLSLIPNPKHLQLEKNQYSTPYNWITESVALKFCEPDFRKTNFHNHSHRLNPLLHPLIRFKTKLLLLWFDTFNCNTALSTVSLLWNWHERPRPRSSSTPTVVSQLAARDEISHARPVEQARNLGLQDCFATPTNGPTCNALTTSTANHENYTKKIRLPHFPLLFRLVFSDFLAVFFKQLLARETWWTPKHSWLPSNLSHKLLSCLLWGLKEFNCEKDVRKMFWVNKDEPINSQWMNVVFTSKKVVLFAIFWETYELLGEGVRIKFLPNWNLVLYFFYFIFVLLQISSSSKFVLILFWYVYLHELGIQC